jgi:hypothetical protein
MHVLSVYRLSIKPIMPGLLHPDVVCATYDGPRHERT